MSTLETIPTDIFKDILFYLDAEEMAVLLNTFSKRLIQIFAFPDLISGLIFSDQRLSLRHDVLYLLRTIRSAKSVKLGHEAAFSENQLFSLSQIPTIESLDIDHLLVVYDLKAIAEIYSDANDEPVKPETWKIPSIVYNDMVSPDIGVLFPNLRDLSFRLGHGAMISEFKSDTSSKQRQKILTPFLDQLAIHFPASLEKLDMRVSPSVNHAVNMSLSLWVNRLPSNLRNLKISFSLAAVLTDYPPIWPFPHLSKLDLTFHGEPELNRNPQCLPPTITDLTFRYLWPSYAFKIFSGQWVPFKDLIYLESLEIGLLNRNEIGKGTNQKPVDLNDVMPASLRTLRLRGDEKGINSMAQCISALPIGITSLVIEGMNFGCECLFPLISNLPNLKVLVEGTPRPVFSLKADQWSLLPSTLEKLETYGYAFHSDAEFCELPSAAIDTHQRSTTGSNPTIEDIKTPKTFFPAESSKQVPMEVLNHVSEMQKTVSGLPSLILPTLPMIPHALREAKLSIASSRLALQFRRQYPHCRLKVLGMMLLDAATWRILLDEARFAQDGVLDFQKLPGALAALLPSTNLDLKVPLEALASVLELPYWSYVHTLRLEARCRNIYGSLTCFVRYEASNMRHLPKMVHLKTLSIHWLRSTMSLLEIPPLPPNLTNFQSLAPIFLPIAWFVPQLASPEETLGRMRHLVRFEAESMQDSAIYTLFEGLSAIQNVILRSNLVLSGSLLPPTLERLTWQILVDETIKKLESRVKTLTYAHITLETPLSLPTVLMLENSPLKTLDMGYSFMAPETDDTKEGLGITLAQSAPLTDLLTKLPLSLKKFEFASASSVKPVSISSLVDLLTPLKALQQARIDCPIDFSVTPKTVFRLSHNLPPNLESLHFPTAQNTKRTAVVLQPPPALKEFCAPLLMLHPGVLLPNSIRTLVVANQDMMQRQPPSSDLENMSDDTKSAES